MSRKEKLENGVIGFGCTAKESVASEEGCRSERVASLKGWGQHETQGQVCMYYLCIMITTYNLSKSSSNEKQPFPQPEPK